MTWELWNKLREDPGDKRCTDLVYAGIYDSQSISVASDEVEVIEGEEIDGVVQTYALWPVTLKYFDYQNESLGLSRSSCDNIIYRYAGVLLMYAECLNETGQSGELGGPEAYVNLVRTRAGASPISGGSQEEMRLAVENENLLELNFEGHRWFNLVRTGRITEVMEAHFSHRTPGLSAVIQANDNGMVVEDANSTDGIALKWKWSGSNADVLFPVPYDQIQLTDWEQNEIYR